MAASYVSIPLQIKSCLCETVLVHVKMTETKLVPMLDAPCWFRSTCTVTEQQVSGLRAGGSQVSVVSTQQGFNSLNTILSNICF